MATGLRPDLSRACSHKTTKVLTRDTSIRAFRREQVVTGRTSTGSHARILPQMRHVVALSAASSLAVIASFLSLSSSVAVAAESSPRCTIEGSKRAETLRGTNKPDVICGRGGDDRIIGRNGRDVILAGGGDDRVLAGDGKDRLSGGAGDDILAGENNDDRLDGGSGVDELDGGAGHDHCDGADAKDILDTNCAIAFSVRSVSLQPAAVDTSSSAQPIAMSVELEKTQNWYPTLHRIYVNEERVFGEPDFGNLADPQNIGYLSLVSGTPEAGTWSGTIALPQGSAAGPHALSLLLVEGFGISTGEVIDSYEVLSAYDLMRANLPFFVFATK